MSNSINYYGKNCEICRDPLANEKPIAFHENYTNTSGRVCVGSQHPLHLECAIEAIKAKPYCCHCRVPISLKSLGLYTLNRKKIDWICFSAGMITSSLAGYGTGYYGWAVAKSLVLHAYDQSTVNHIFIMAFPLMIYVGCKIAEAVGPKAYEIAEKIVTQPEIATRLGCTITDTPGAKMTVVETKPKLNQG